MTIPFLAVILLFLICSIYLVRIHLQINRWAKDLEQTEGGSNLRLTSSVRTPCMQSLCRAFNARLSREQKTCIRQQMEGKNLKYTISCISHDIRTPLTGASGYLELALSTSDKKQADHYMEIIQKRLKDLESLLEELFLYTKLTQAEYTLDLQPAQPYQALCGQLAAYYDRIESAGFALELEFPQEGLTITGNDEALRRIFSNLLKNALHYGKDTISITQQGYSLTFANPVPDRSNIDTLRLFDRFYKADTSRHGNGSGLGLSIVKQLMEKMGGGVSASLDSGRLKITLSFSCYPQKDSGQ